LIFLDTRKLLPVNNLATKYSLFNKETIQTDSTRSNMANMALAYWQNANSSFGLQVTLTISLMNNLA